ncbi:MAG TPA: hypothetical protein VEW71_02900 [Allosphingosinicella sp.]|nr:hypothetical protein [Allosphingosinicella sp.]
MSTDQTILGLDGKVVANGQVHFYDKKTGEYAPVFGDSGLSVSLRQPVQADSSGVLPAIYLDDAIAYRAVITDRKNNRVREIDDVRRLRDGIKVVGGIDALKRYCGEDPFVLVAAEGGCPVFYKRLTGCDLPAEHLPEVVRAECGCDCSVAWQLCGSEPDICAMETAELNCDYHVLVQECPRAANPVGAVNPDGTENPCHCDDGSTAAAPVVKKASIGALLSAGARCLPRVCIRHDAPELALDPSGGLVYGDREPPPIQSSVMNGSFAQCMRIFVGTDADSVSHHLQLDNGIVKDLAGNVPKAPEITLTNPGPCRRRYEIRALNRLNRAKELAGGAFGGVPVLNANMQTRLGRKTDPRLNDTWAVADFMNQLPWLTELSIADSTMGPFISGHLGATNAGYDPYKSANGYTENDLIVDLNPGDTIVYALKYHIYWDMNATAAQLQAAERVHFGTRIIARQVH